MKVWLDDLRRAPEGWVRVTTVTQAIELLQTGKVEELSLDHDLGIVDSHGREQTGYDVLLWIEQQVTLEAFAPPVLIVHSANPPAHDRMLRAIQTIVRASRGAGE